MVNLKPIICPVITDALHSQNISDVDIFHDPIDIIHNTFNRDNAPMRTLNANIQRRRRIAYKLNSLFMYGSDVSYICERPNEYFDFEVNDRGEINEIIQTIQQIIELNIEYSTPLESFDKRNRDNDDDDYDSKKMKMEMFGRKNKKKSKKKSKKNKKSSKNNKKRRFKKNKRSPKKNKKSPKKI